MISRFTRYVKKCNCILVYNTFTNSCISLNLDSVYDAKKYIKECDDNILYELGIKTKYNEDDLMREYYNNLRNSKETLYVMLIMTYGCNMKCTYCFEENVCNEKEFLFEDEVDDIIEYLLKLYSSGYNKLEIHYFGGEPLLKLDKILKINSILIDEGVNLHSNIITNGTLLNKNNTIKSLNAGITNFQITLDGPKFIHDERRPLKSGVSSYEKIIENLKSLSSLKVNISLRINVDHMNYEFLDLLLEDLSKLDVNYNFNVYLSPVVGVIEGDFNNTLRLRKKTLTNAWKKLKKSNIKFFIDFPRYAPCPFISKSSAFYIDLKGNKYTCGGFVGNKNKIEGKYDDDYLIKTDRISKPHFKENCLKCSLFPICMGGCVYESETFNNHCQYSYLSAMIDEFYSNYLEV